MKKTVMLRKFEKVCEIIENYSSDPLKLIPILQEVQKEYRYLPEEVLTFVATSLGLSPARVFGVASFYAHFSLKPKGKYLIRLCDGTACHVKGSESLLKALYQRLNIDKDNNTTPDMLFTVETVSCLGTCGLSPAMVINDKVYGQMTADKVLHIVEDIIAREEQNGPDRETD